jgi:hypothetical protein
VGDEQFDLMTVAEAAVFLRLRPSSVYNLVKAGLPAIRMPHGGMRFRRIDLFVYASSFVQSSSTLDQSTGGMR